MLSRPFAFGLVAAACVVAAGGGAYIATLQHARSETALAAPAGQPPAQPAASPQQPAPSAEAAPQAPPVAALPAQPSPDDAPAPSPAPKASAPASSSPARRTVPAPTPHPARAGAERPAEAVEPPQPQKPAAEAAPVPAPIPAPTDVPEREEPKAERIWEEVTVPADSVVGLQLESSLSSETARVEDRVDARVTRDVRINGRVAIPAGARVVGSVILVERGGKIKDRARLGIRFNTLVLADNTRTPITTDTVFREGDAPSTQSSAKIGGAAIGGAIIGAILGGGKGAAIGTGIGAAGGTAAAMAGDRRAVTLPVGTPLSVRTQSPVTLTIER